MRNLTTLLLLLLLQQLGWADAPAPAFRLRGELDVTNIWVVKQQIREYHDGGTYAQELALIAALAREYLAEALGRPGAGKPALVLDIDETALSNYPHIASMDFGYIPSAWKAWIQEAQAPAIQGVLELYRFARSKDVAVLFITGRYEHERAATERNLRQAGYGEWAELIMKPDGDKTATGRYKTAERKRLTQSGYRILANVGDQSSDLERGYSESVFKLPNPMYYVP